MYFPRFFAPRGRSLTCLAALICSVLAASSSEAPAAGTPGYEIIPLGRGNLNRLTLAASIEGTKGLMAVDTGAEGSVMSDGKFGFIRPGPGRQLPAGVPKTAAMNGTRAVIGYARDFHLGNVNIGAFPLCLVSEHELYETKMLYQDKGSRQYDGLIGEEVLRHYNAVVDIGRLALYLNTDPKRKTDPGRGLVAAGWTRIPMRDYGKDFTVDCLLGKKKFRLIVDTGAPFTVLDDHVVRASQVSVHELPIKMGILSTRAQETSLVMSDTLAIGNFVANNVHMVSRAGIGSILHGNFDEPDPMGGLLGGDILGNNRALVDIGNKALYLKR